MATQTALKITNRSGKDVKVYLTLGATPGCVQNVADIPFLTNPVNPLQGWFILMQGASQTYTPPQGLGINGNFTFGSPPLNCPTREYLNGINLAEFIINNSFQGPGAQETIDISCQTEPICNVQRDASNSGGTVEVIFHGFLPN